MDEYNFLNQFWHWHTINTPSPQTFINFSPCLYSVFTFSEVKMVKYDENVAYYSLHLKEHPPKTTE